jgi:hypothetical protein
MFSNIAKWGDGVSKTRTENKHGWCCYSDEYFLPELWCYFLPNSSEKRLIHRLSHNELWISDQHHKFCNIKRSENMTISNTVWRSGNTTLEAADPSTSVAARRWQKLIHLHELINKVWIFHMQYIWTFSIYLANQEVVEIFRHYVRIFKLPQSQAHGVQDAQNWRLSVVTLWNDGKSDRGCFNTLQFLCRERLRLYKQNPQKVAKLQVTRRVKYHFLLSLVSDPGEGCPQVQHLSTQERRLFTWQEDVVLDVCSMKILFRDSYRLSKHNRATSTLVAIHYGPCVSSLRTDKPLRTRIYHDLFKKCAKKQMECWSSAGKHKMNFHSSYVSFSFIFFLESRLIISSSCVCLCVPFQRLNHLTDFH